MTTYQITEDDQAQIIFNTGVALKKISHHAMERAEERNISLESIVNILKNGRADKNYHCRNGKLGVKVHLGVWRVVIGADGCVASVVKCCPFEKRQFEKQQKKMFGRG